jgi:uncharacterized paraquat-inducible protein A
VAALHEKLGNEAAALEHATSLVMLDPDATSHRERLTRLAEKTGKLEHNPHASHEGDLSCESCHHAHKPSEDHCAKCHTFGMKVP